MVKNIRWIFPVSYLCLFLLSKVSACEYNVRDIGFVTIELRSYYLYFYIQDDTPQGFIQTIKQTSLTIFEETNVTSEIINVTRQKDHPAMEYCRFWELQSFPAAILVSPDGRSLGLPISTSSKSFSEISEDFSEGIVSSPVREEIRERIVQAYCIILLFEGNNAAENNKIHAELSGAVQKIGGMMKQLPKRIEEPPFITRIPQESFVREKILLWSLNLSEQEINKPQTMIIYGRGRQFGPALIGDQITQREMVNILGMIGLSCECGLDRKWMLGTLLPLRWEQKIQSEVVDHLGFDAENPMVRMEVSQIVSFNRDRVFDYKNEQERVANSYGEEIVKHEENTSPKKLSPSQFQALNSPGASANQGSENGGTIQYSKDSSNDSEKTVSIIKRDSNTANITANQSQLSEIQKSLSAGIGDNLKVSLLISGIIAIIVLALGLYILWQRRSE